MEVGRGSGQAVWTRRAPTLSSKLELSGEKAQSEEDREGNPNVALEIKSARNLAGTSSRNSYRRAPVFNNTSPGYSL